ncbi:MAG: hypothetical protein AAF533_29650 [Acidobacteriota bacterium]
MRLLLLTSFVVLALPAVSSAQPLPVRLLVSDADSHARSAVSAGAVFGIELGRSPTADPDVLAAADQSAPELEFVSGVARSNEGVIVVTDLGVDRMSGLRDGQVRQVLGLGTTRRLDDGATFVDPFGVCALPDGRFVVSDRDADPSGLGNDREGRAGHGALFIVDHVADRTTLLSDGSDHAIAEITGPSAFQDPLGIWCEGDSVLVADFWADLDTTDTQVGAIYRVRVSDGFVSLVTWDSEIIAPLDVASMSDGTVLVADTPGGVAPPIVFAVDPTGEPRSNASVLSWNQYGTIEGVAVGPFDEVYIVDSGLYNETEMRFEIDPGIYRLDPAPPDRNAVVVSSSLELVTPVGLAVETTDPPGLIVSAPLDALPGGDRPTIHDVTRASFAPSCPPTAPFSFCAVQAYAGPLGPLRIPEPMGDGALFLFQHSDPVDTMTVRRDGADLVFESR